MLELIIHGGAAMWVIVGCSVFAIAITLERWRTLHQVDIDSEELLDKVSRALETNNVAAAISICNETRGPVADTLSTGLRKLTFLERIGKRPEEIEAGIVEAMEEHSAHVVSFLERNLTALATVASIAPILGMLGTVTGMIKSFGAASKQGNMTPEAVAGGISEALICTAGGLVVALIATSSYNYFTTRVNRFVLQVQAAATALVERVLQTQSQAAPPVQSSVAQAIPPVGAPRAAAPRVTTNAPVAGVAVPKRVSPPAPRPATEG